MQKLLWLNIIIGSILIEPDLIAQQIYFNERYQINGPGIWSTAKTMVSVEDGYIIAGGTGDTTEYFWILIGILKIDLYGNHVWSKSYGDLIATWFTGFPGCLIKNDESSYYLGGAKQYYSPRTYGSGLLFKFNADWDTLWSVEIKDRVDPVDTSTNFDNIYKCFNSDLVFTGQLYEFGSTAKTILVRTDSSGNLKFYRSYGNSGINRGYSVIQTSDSGFAIGGFWYVPGSDIHTGDPIIIKTDSLGNQQWLKNIGEPIIDNKAMLCHTPDGYIIAGTTIADSLYGGTDAWSRINIVKLDNSGNILWNKKYCEHSLENDIMNIRCLEDGSLVATGSRIKNDPIARNRGWMLKVDADGDSLWYREFVLLMGDDSRNYLYDVIPTADSGFLACGFVFPQSPDTGTQDAWVIKLDSLGCDTAGCDPSVGIAEDPFIAGQDEAPLKLEIWPNPAKRSVWVSLNSRQQAVGSRQSIGEFTLKIYDIWGRKIMEKPWPEGTERLELDVGTLPDGLYLCVLNRGQEQWLSVKLLVNHD